MKQSKQNPKKATAEAKKPVLSALSKKSSIHMWLAALYGAQAIAILILAIAKNMAVTGSYSTKDALASDLAGHQVLATATRHLFELNLAHVVGAMLAVSALAHVAAMYYRSQKAEVVRGASKIRWAEYSLVASLMLVALGLLTGVQDAGTLILLISSAWVAGLAGLGLQTYGTGRSRADWLVILIAAVAGLAPWVVLGMAVWQVCVYGGYIPTYVYFLYLTAILYMKGMGLVAILQYKKWKRFTDPLYADRAYLIVGLVTLSAFAWQIYTGVLRP